MKTTLQSRPAESGSIAAAAIAYLLGRIFNWDVEVVLNVSLLIGLVPAGITWLVEKVRNAQ